jgi:hypothetical protein
MLFELPYDLTDAVFGMKAHQQMDVVFVITHLHDGEFILQLNLSQGVGNTCRGRVVKQRLAILHRKDEMVMRVVDAVIRSCDSHLTIIIDGGNRWFPPNSPPAKVPAG